RIHQVVWNLVSNAIKFTPAGGIVEVRLESLEDRLELKVTDTGVGIDADALAHVFEPAWQSPSQSSKGGLGLGLSIVQRVVEMHGGSVRAESPGLQKGSTFVVDLPLAQLIHSD